MTGTPGVRRLVVLTVFLAGALSARGATGFGARVPPVSPRPPETKALAPPATESSRALHVPPFRAVLMVGPIGDGESASRTLTEIRNTDLAAAEVETDGVTVYRRSGYWQYHNGFAGLPSETLESLLDAPVLGNLADVLTFTYSIPEHRLLPTSHRLTPLNVGNTEVFTWTLNTLGGWFAVSPAAGTTPASFWLTPTTFATTTATTYTGAVTITVTEPAGVEGSPHRINLTLQVVERPLAHAYLPVVTRAYTPPPPPPRYPNDPYLSSQWAWDRVDAPEGWALSTGHGVLIAVLDTGTDLDHPDLASKVRTDIDYDFVNGDNVADDDNGHGTHVSGIAAAATDNGIGVAGMGWEAAILPLKVLDSAGEGTADNLATAIRYAADQGAGVVNMSLGGAFSCPWYVQQKSDYAYNLGVVLVAAAGNDGAGQEVFPANCAHVLGVAATDSYDSRASFSNWGNHVSVAAPGTSIYSTTPYGQYGYMQGTSMATPFVAGLAGLVRARFGTYTPDQVASAILDNAQDLGTAGWDPYYGCGRINAFRALWVGAPGSSPLCLGSSAWSDGAEPALVSAPFVPGQVIVSLHSNTNAQAVSLRYGARAEFLPALEGWRLQVPVGQEQSVLARLRADPAVAHADLNYVVSAQ